MAVSKIRCKFCQSSDEIKITGGGWTTIYVGKEFPNRIFIYGVGDGYTDKYYPNFCPNCGKKLNQYDDRYFEV